MIIRGGLGNFKMRPRVLILSGYGINCERETEYAFDMVGGDAEVVHVNDLISKDKSLDDYQILAVPGGFSYGDDTGSGNAMANKIRLNLWDDLMRFVDAGKLVIGICNGFQVLVNLGLLPSLNKSYGERQAALTFNNSTRYECRWAHLKNNDSKCVFTKGLDNLYVPVAHGEGKFFADDETLNVLERNGQIVFSYTLPNGELANGEFPFNPNGSLKDIAGICDESGRIFGMMPHPERAVLSASAPDFQKTKEEFKRRGETVPVYYDPAVAIFRNAVDYVKGDSASYELNDINEFKGKVLDKTMNSDECRVVIMAGSGSDKGHIEKVGKSLSKYNIPYSVRICSAHKQADRLIELIKEYNKVGGMTAYVAIAGGTDALSGTLSYHALGPVISCPPDAPNDSCLTNPPGSSNAYVVRPGNVGKFIAQMFAGLNPGIREMLENEKVKKIASLEKADAEFRSGEVGCDESEMMGAEEAKKLIEDYIAMGDEVPSTQEILDSGAIPRLRGYKVRPGKVSDSIFGGRFSYLDKKSGQMVEYENPPLNAKDGTSLRIMVRTPRISTHDINRGEIPFKDQILAVNHNFMRRMLAPILGTSQIEVPGLADNSIVIVAENLKQLSYENVVRAFMAKSSTSTSLYQHYLRGDRTFCGHKLPDGLITNGPLPYVMDTPSTKSDEHDESVAPERLFDGGVCTREQYAQIRNSSMFAFGVISEFLERRGLIAVDTKTEHGVNSKGEVVSQDEIWTMDSSRFWLLDDYKDQLEKLKRGEITELAPKSYSKEFARGFSKGELGYSDEERVQIAIRYIEGVQHLLGKRFKPDLRPHKERVVSGINTVLDELVN